VGPRPTNYSQRSRYDTRSTRLNQQTKRPTLHRPKNRRRQGQIRPKRHNPRPILPKTPSRKPPLPRPPQRLPKRLRLPPIPNRPNLDPRTRPHSLETRTNPIHGTANRARIRSYASRTLHARQTHPPSQTLEPPTPPRRPLQLPGPKTPNP
jgi:hypothetical protein